MTPEQLIKAREMASDRAVFLGLHETSARHYCFDAGWCARERLLQEERDGLVEALEYYASARNCGSHYCDWHALCNNAKARAALSAYRKLECEKGGER
jgi:predicted N-acyltransferase